MSRYPDATIAVFAYDGFVTVNLMSALIVETSRWKNVAIWTESGDALISRTRSKIATQFLEQGLGDVLVMIDHDINWAPGDLVSLVNACKQVKGIVGGVYPKRGFGIGVPARLLTTDPVQFGSDALAPAQHIGTGFMAIHRKALEKIAADLPMTIHRFKPIFATELYQFPDDPGKWEYFSEDYAFCQRAIDKKVKVFAYLKPTLTHYGHHMYRMVDQSITLPTQENAQIQMQVTEKSDWWKLPDCDKEVKVPGECRIITPSVQAGRGWEQGVVETAKRYARPGDTLLEIGAHVGVHAVQLADTFDHIYSIEPVPETYALLLENLEHNKVANVTPINTAAWFHDRGVKISYDPNNSGYSHTEGLKAQVGIEVSSATLEQIKAQYMNKYPEIIKADAEGSEYAMFAECPEFLDNARVVLAEYCELQVNRSSSVKGLDYLKLLRDHGFIITLLDDTLIENDKDLPTGDRYINLVAVRPEDRVPVPQAVKPEPEAVPV